jgi:hypothetical protein
VIERLERHSAWLLLAGMMLLAFVVRARMGARIEAPQLLCDEFIYGDIARSFADEGRLLLRGHPSYQSVLYPILLAPAWIFSSLDQAYEAAKAINAALMTATAVPVYLWARRLVPQRWALLAPGLTLLLPAQLYSGLLLTENAFLPAFVLACYLIARTVESPTVPGQLLALAAVGIACAVRLQGLVLLAVLPAAVVIALLLELRDAPPGDRARTVAARLAAWWPSAGLLAIAAVGYAVLQVAQGESLSAGLGAYSDALSRDYSLDAGWQFAKLHFAALAVLVGVVPLSALVVIASGRLSPPRRAFAATAGAAIVLLTLQVGLFESRFGGSIAERYVFHVAPLLFLALAVWLADGLARPLLATAVAAAVPVGLVLAQPLSTYLGTDQLISSFTLFAFFRLARDLGSIDEAIWVLRLGTLVAMLAFALLWRPVARVVIPAGIAAFLLLAQWPAYGNLVEQSRRVGHAPGVGARPSWIDARLGEDANVAFIYTPTADGSLPSTSVLLELGFFNRSLTTVVNLGTPEACPLPERAAQIDPGTGQIEIAGGDHPDHVVAERGLSIAGTPLDAEGPLVLYRVAPPLSLSTASDGLYADGWTGPRAQIVQYRTPGQRAGRTTVSVSRTGWSGVDVPGNVTVTVSRLEAGARIDRKRVVIHAGETHNLTLRTPKPPFRVEVTVDPTFSPADFGQGDARDLGVQLSYSFEP